MLVIIFGRPGAGKGTHGKTLAKAFGIPYIGTGDILRQRAACDLKIGNLMEEYAAKGHLLPDEILNPIVLDCLSKHKDKGAIIDGYPRNETQARFLLGYHTSNEIRIDWILNFVVSELVAIKRLMKRGRSDDSDISVIRDRMEVYEKETLPALCLLEQHLLVSTVDGEGSIEEVKEKIILAWEDYSRKVLRAYYDKFIDQELRSKKYILQRNMET